MDFFTRIAEHTPQLNKNDNELLSYCIRNHTEIANLKVTELADRLFISPASVVRFCKKLGFSGYSDFKASLRMDLFEPEETPRKSHPTDFFRDIHKTIEMVSEETVERLQTIGKAAFCYDDSTLMNISARQLTSDDLVLALSISGETSLIIAAATVAKSRGAALVSFTNLGNNTLSGMADENLYVNATNFVCSGLPVQSRVQLLMLCEYLFFRYIETYGDEHQQSIG